MNKLFFIIKTSKHFILTIIALLSLWCLSIVDKAEVLTLGVIVNRGVDFFTLFGDENKKSLKEVKLKDVEDRWNEIDKGKGSIKEADAVSFLAKKKQGNFFNRFFYSLSAKLDFVTHFEKLFWVLLIVASLKAFFLFFSRYLTQVLSIRISKNLREEFFEHIQFLPMSFYQKYNVGSLTNRALGDAGQIASSLNSVLINYLQFPFIIFTSLLACFLISYKLSLILFVGLPLVIFPVVFLTRRIKRISKEMLKKQEVFTSLLIDFLSGIQTIKIFAMEFFSLKKFKDANDHIARLEKKSAKYSLLTRPILHLITTLCLVAIVLLGLGILHMGVAELLLYAALLHQFYEPIKKFSEENANIQKGVVAAERMFEILNLPVQRGDGQLEFIDFKNKIEFSHVSFKYKDQWILKDVSFTILKGDVVAFVGPTGSGKSSLLQLLPRLYDPQEGEILIDGVSIKNFGKRSLREKISFVPQKPFLFHDSVEENIAFGRSFTKTEIYEAAKKAHAHEFIMELEDQYKTLLAESGKSLSGGQQQRLAIARALIKKAPILILDEATSALDAMSEQKIKEALKSLDKGITQIIVAHRLSTIEHATKIIYLENGKKIAEGSRDFLLSSSKEFQKMWQSYHVLKR